MRRQEAILRGFPDRVKRLIWLAATLIWLMAASPSPAQNRTIVQVNGGLPVMQLICGLLGCNVQYGLGDPAGQFFLITSQLPILGPLLQFLGVESVEPDVAARAMDATYAGTTPAALYDATPVGYYGTTVREGYLNQPAAQIVGVASTQSAFGVSGAGIVAVIDTGVDTTHPVLQRVLLPGYDFTRNRSGADEKADVTQSTTAVVDQSTTAVVDQSTTAVVDRYTANTLNQPQYQDFGHGTMVSGVIHLVAPTASILPLKAFQANGSGYISDVIRAVYYAVGKNAKVINMSFSTPTASHALKGALDYANTRGVISVAAAGNSGTQTLVYPAAWQADVMGVASTSNNDTLSLFSNYGPNLVWVGAPGEGVVTLYPYGTYAATWGTSFSTPFVSGAAALLLSTHTWKGALAVCDQAQAESAIANAKYISSNVGHGRLELYQAVEAWRRFLGL